MCQFNYIVIPRGADADALRELAWVHKFGFAHCSEHALHKHLRPTEVLYCATSGHCDCGSCVGSGTHKKTASHDLGAQVEKLAAKGWSEAKVERWRAEKEAAYYRSLGRRWLSAQAMTEDAQEWCDFLTEAVKVGATAWIGLIHVWEGEGFAELKREFRASDLKLKQLAPETVLTLARYHLLRIHD